MLHVVGQRGDKTLLFYRTGGIWAARSLLKRAKVGAVGERGGGLGLFKSFIGSGLHFWRGLLLVGACR